MEQKIRADHNCERSEARLWSKHEFPAGMKHYFLKHLYIIKKPHILSIIS